MTARELLVDFVNYVFFIALSVFCVFYFVLGGRLEELIEILKSMAPLSIFGLAFLFKLKGFLKNSELAHRIDGFNNEEIWYVSETDVFKDRLITVFLPISTLALAFIDGEVDVIDIYQAFFCFFYILFFHYLLLRKKDGAETRTLNKSQKIRDEIVIFFLPLMMLLIPLSNNLFDTVDILQTVSVFAIMVVWHNVLFKR